MAAPRVALVHDWLVAHRGGEKVLLEIARMFPQAPVYTLVFDAERAHPEFSRRGVVESYIATLPGGRTHFRSYLPLFPHAIEQFDLRKFDLVISTSHCVAKGVVTRGSTKHLSYVHTPMRYIWDQFDAYLPSMLRPWPVRGLVRAAITPLRRWDVASSKRPDRVVANSKYVAKRIQRVWGRRASVIYPPVDAPEFRGDEQRDRRALLTVNALVPYKRTELAVIFATRSARPLVVVGEGPERGRLQAIAGPTVTFRGAVSGDELHQLYARSGVFVHGGVEDFGIAPVEAMAAGCAVVALAEGGVTETVEEGRSGVFFSEASPAALADAVTRIDRRYAAGAIDSADIRRRALRFSSQKFRSSLYDECLGLGFQGCELEGDA